LAPPGPAGTSTGSSDGQDISLGRLEEGGVWTGRSDGLGWPAYQLFALLFRGLLSRLSFGLDGAWGRPFAELLPRLHPPLPILPRLTPDAPSLPAYPQPERLISSTTSTLRTRPVQPFPPTVATAHPPARHWFPHIHGKRSPSHLTLSLLPSTDISPLMSSLPIPSSSTQPMFAAATSNQRQARGSPSYDTPSDEEINPPPDEPSTSPSDRGSIYGSDDDLRPLNALSPSLATMDGILGARPPAMTVPSDEASRVQQRTAQCVNNRPLLRPPHIGLTDCLVSRLATACALHTRAQSLQPLPKVVSARPT
jgi:hypothetical protein